MRKSLFMVLAAAVALLAAAPGYATASAAPAPLLCPATATVEEPENLPAEETEVEVDEALLAEEALLPDDALIPKPVPTWCPYNEPCTFFCLDYPDCPPPECINGVCVYGW